ncbi:MAG: hypothetical protein IK138_01965 [Lachnospiraceae bacterium]|nr:hypothetical protein [Lachnospiraceae bacterium]
MDNKVIVLCVKAENVKVFSAFIYIKAKKYERKEERMKKGIQRAIALAVLIVFTICITNSNKVLAHNLDYWSGYYSGVYNQHNIKFRIEPSALTSILTQSVYYSAFSWNGISNGVGSVGIATYAPGLPYEGYFPVCGYVWYDGTLGETVPRDAEGDIVGELLDWDSVCIRMNTNSSCYGTYTERTRNAKKTFIHEVGHALKLSHPDINEYLSGHIYSGRPYAVMNQGLCGNGSYVASSVELHDRQNLIAKWGY